MFLSHLKWRLSLLDAGEELQGRATIPRVPQMSASIPKRRLRKSLRNAPGSPGLCFPATFAGSIIIS